ncbi:hypothetical protein BJ875DRAFT_481984 [Amylocarpus encephaloides]|uniref:Uncharacterized protein n=1 Tax=Amylocarpus encephaloides TaxID=45428 RepID=A0A9P8C7I0_9HELO|nr:hypothetical protein BJ875DRAFT_481984 [Amylocarpus encephaloides]
MVRSTELFFSASVIATLVSATSWGSCKEPTITFKSDSGFEATNKDSFSHGATKELAPITDYLCSTVQNQCKAPGDAYKLCQDATAAGKAKTGADAAVAFNDALKGVTATTSSAAPAATKSDRWFDNKITVTNDACDESAIKMPDGKQITFRCHGNVAGKTVPAMLASLKVLTPEGDWFKHYTKKDTHCASYNTQGGCVSFSSKSRPKTSFPKTMSIYVKQGDYDEGEFSYAITDSAKGRYDCIACKLAGAGLGFTGIMAPALAPIYGAAILPVTLSCATAGC